MPMTQDQIEEQLKAIAARGAALVHVVSVMLGEQLKNGLGVEVEAAAFAKAIDDQVDWRPPPHMVGIQASEDVRRQAMAILNIAKTRALEG